MLLVPASGRGGRLLLFPAGSFVVLAGLATAGVITFTFRANYIPPETPQPVGRVDGHGNRVRAHRVPQA
jgi:hypothetical protein